jgi:lipopolysaccharide export LptBFGC system permease protein LptF
MFRRQPVGLASAMSDLRRAIDRARDGLPRLPGGVYTGYMLRQALRHWLITLIAIVSLITAIHVSIELPGILAKAAAKGPDEGTRQALLFIVSIIIETASGAFCISLLLSIVSAETTHALGGRLLMVRITGLSFLRRSTALLILAAIAVPVQFLLDDIARPWAYDTLAHEGIGDPGFKYGRERIQADRWFAFGDVTVRALVHDEPVLTLSNALIYRFDAEGVLASITTAATIVPDMTAQDAWTMQDAKTWRMGDPHDKDFGMPTAPTGTAGLDFPVSLLWFEHRGTEPRFLHFADLLRLTYDVGLPAEAPGYFASAVNRVMQAFLTGLTCVCVASAFAVLLELYGPIIAAGGGLVSAYVCHFFNRLANLAVENAPVPEIIMALIMLAIPALVAWRLITMLRRWEAAR